MVYINYIIDYRITIYSIIEASPAVYGNKLVVGTRGYMIHCLTIE